jgi:hypothetical protein
MPAVRSGSISMPQPRFQFSIRSILAIVALAAVAFAAMRQALFIFSFPPEPRTAVRDFYVACGVMVACCFCIAGVLVRRPIFGAVFGGVVGVVASYLVALLLGLMVIA